MDKKQMLARQQEIISTAKAEGRDLTAEEKREFDDLTAKIKNLSAGAEGEGEKGANEAANRAAEAERARAAEITTLCRNFEDVGLNAENLIREGKTVAEVKDMILDHQMKSSAPATVRVTADEGDKIRAAASDGLLLRAGLSLGENASKREEAAAPYRTLSLERMAIDSLRAEGIDGSRMSKDELYQQVVTRQFFNPSSAFPSIMDQAIRKAYEAGYNEVNVTWDMWAAIGTLTDFKKQQGNYVAGAAGDFLEVPENGELKADKPTDHKRPERQLKTYGRQFSMSRQAFINDDIGFITTVPARYAAAAQRTINRQVYGVIYNNGVIYDGKALFCEDHKNLIKSGAKPTLESLKATRMLLQKQTGLDGQSINIRPRYILTPSDYEMDFAELLLAPTLSDASVTGKFNPFYGKNYQVIVDDTIASMAGSSAVPWFMVGDKADALSVQVDFLNGQRIPTIRRSEVPGTLGFVWDIYLDWGISVMDFRGIAKNPGVAL